MDDLQANVEIAIKQTVISHVGLKKADTYLRRHFSAIKERAYASSHLSQEYFAITRPYLFFQELLTIVDEAPDLAEEAAILKRDYSSAIGDRKREPDWIRVREDHLANQAECVACGNANNLTVHHIKPVSLAPHLELEPSNLLTLCERHHLEIGHHGDWRVVNPNVVAEALEHRKKLGLPDL